MTVVEAGVESMVTYYGTLSHAFINNDPQACKYFGDLVKIQFNFLLFALYQTFSYIITDYEKWAN